MQAICYCLGMAVKCCPPPVLERISNRLRKAGVKLDIAVPSPKKTKRRRLVR